MKKFYSCWIFLFFSILLMALSPEELKSYSERATVALFPDADTVLLYDDQSIRYEADGTAVDVDDFYQKVLTEKGRKQLETIPLYFHTSFESIQVEAFEIIRPDGKIMPIDQAAHSKIMVDSSQMDSNIFDPNSKIMLLSVPGLEVGDILHLKVREVTKKSRIQGVWTTVKSLQSSSPILDYIITINAPKDKPLLNKIIKNEVPNSVTFSENPTPDGRIVYRYQAKNVPQLLPEPDAPPLYLYAQRLLASSAAGWQDISSWYYRLSRPHLDKVTPEMREKVRELTANCKTDDEKIMALFQFVSQQIRYMGITPEEESPGYEPHDVDLTFNNRYGVCRDKAALLVTMLELAGLKAYPSLFYVGPPKDDEVPNTYFNHAIVAVERDGSYILMDPTYETTTELLPASLSNKSYLVAKPDGEKLLRSKETPSERNALTIQTRADLGENGELKVTSELLFGGINDSIYRDAFSRWPQEYRLQFFSTMLKRAIPGADLAKVEILPSDVRDMKQPLKVLLSYQVPNFIDPEQKLLLLPPVTLADHIGAAAMVLGKMGLEKRLFPMEIYSSCQTDEAIQLTLPPQLKLEHGIDQPLLANDSFAFSRSVKPLQNGPIELKYHKAIKQTLIEPAQYAELKQLLKSVEKSEQQRPVLLRAALGTPQERYPKADSVLLLDQAEIRFTDTHSWTETHHIQRLILNYAGVKSNSELQIAYNPVWESVEIIEAKITGVDGQSHPITPKEINHMDQAWCGDAPAYPAGKILVASFPGVAPGSVIDYTYRITRRDQPFFSDILVFGSTDPILEQSVTLFNAPASLRHSTPPSQIQFTSTSDSLQWLARNLDPIPAEASRAPLWMFAPSIFLSTETPAAFAEALRTSLFAKTQNQPLAAAKARELTQNLPDETAKIRAIRDFVAKTVRLAGPDLNQLPWSTFSTADQTLGRSYGDSADRAILLSSMLQSVGIDSEFVAVSDLACDDNFRRGLFRIEVGKTYLQNIFTGIQLLVVSGFKTVAVLNANNQYASLTASPFREMLALELSRKNFRSFSAPAINQESFSCQISLATDGSAIVTLSTTDNGIFQQQQNQQFSEFTPEEKKRHIQSLVASFSQSAQLDAPFQYSQTDDAFKTTIQVKIPNFLKKSGPYAYFDLPKFNTLTQLLRTSAKTRSTPAWFNQPRAITLHYQIIYPNNFTLQNPPPDQLELKLPRLNWFYQFHPSDHTINLVASLSIAPGLLSTTEYPAWVTLQSQLGSQKLKTILFEVK